MDTILNLVAIIICVLAAEFAFQMIERSSLEKPRARRSLFDSLTRFSEKLQRVLFR